MTIKELYARNNVPYEVQTHALAVAAFVSEMRTYWVGPTLDWSVITKAGLFHHIGGIVELKLDDESPLKDLQKTAIETYGPVAKTATVKINKKIGLDKYISAVIAHGVIENAEAIVHSYDLYTKVFLYCDMRAVKQDGSHSVTFLSTSNMAFLDLEKELSQYVYIPIQELSLTISPSCRYDLEHIDVKHYKNPSM